MDIEGLLESEDASAQKMERRILRKGAKRAASYRILTGLYAVRVPSMEAWEDQVGPALEAALDSERPIEALRSTMFSFDDADALLSGPEEPGVFVSFELPAERGEGFMALAAPIAIGPDGNLTNHDEPNKFRVVTGVYARDVERGEDPVVESLGLRSVPEQWTGDRARLPKLNPLPEDGAGAWVKYKGRSYDSGEELLGRTEGIQRIMRVGRTKCFS